MQATTWEHSFIPSPIGDSNIFSVEKKATAEGREEGREEGRAEGREEGRAEEKLATARNFKACKITSLFFSPHPRWHPSLRASCPSGFALPEWYVLPNS